MRSFKKVLTLALVFAMALGLLTAGALNFTDADDIQYKTAVEVMTNLGAINGYTDGTFRPDGLVTRAEAAKLVTYAILTPKVAEFLPKGTTSFTDVPATHWAAPYIEYCVSQGIINGKGNGKFDPNGNVTAYELAKMLLVAAGYGRKNEYVGANWSLNVAIDAIDKGIFTGSKAANYGAPATREEAALYAFNALTKVNQVNFNKTTDDYDEKEVNGNPITIGEQKYGLAVDTDTVNGIDGYVWVDGDGNELSSFIPTDNVLGTSLFGVSVATLAYKSTSNPVYIAELSTTPVPKFYVNGSPVAAYNTSVAGYDVGEYFVEDNEVYVVVDAIEQGETFATANEQEKVQNLAATRGVIVNFVDNAPEKRDGKADKITMIHKTVTTLTGNPTVAKDGKVTVPGIATNVAANRVPGYEALARNDVVLWYQDANGVYHMEKATFVAGQATAKKSNGDLVFEGKTYSISGLLRVGDVVSDVTFYVDSYAYLDNAGNIVKVVAAAEGPAPQYAILLDSIEVGPSGWKNDTTYYEAKLLFLDGSTKIVTWANPPADEEGSADGNGDERAALENKFFTYTVNAQGAYSLEEVTGTGITYDDVYGSITPNKAVFATGHIGNAGTLFILEGSIVGKPNTYVVYKGIANVPKLDDTTKFAVLKEDNIATFVFVYAGALDVETVPDTAYFINDRAFTYYPAVTGVSPAYYEFTVIADGELKTIKVATSLVKEADLANDSVKVGLYQVTYTGDTITAIGSEVTANSGIGTTGVADGVLLLGDTGFTYNENTVVFFITAQGVQKISVDDIGFDENDGYIVTLVPNTSDLAAVVIITQK